VAGRRTPCVTPDGGIRRPLPVLRWCHQKKIGRLIDHRHLPFANRFVAMLPASGAASTLQRGAFRTPVTLADARRCRPTQFSFLHKTHSCDRHHIARAMAELASSLSIIPHMRSKLSPAHAGFFCRRGGSRATVWPGAVVDTSVFTYLALAQARIERPHNPHLYEIPALPIAISAMRASSAIGLHREIFFGGGNLSNSSPGRNRSGSSLGTREYGLDTTLASGAGGDGTTGAG
jgi:hypothetical protein